MYVRVHVCVHVCRQGLGSSLGARPRYSLEPQRCSGTCEPFLHRPRGTDVPERAARS